jgi:hypothetical protein
MIFCAYYKIAVIDHALSDHWNDIVTIPVGLLAPLGAALSLRNFKMLTRFAVFVVSAFIDFMLTFSLLAIVFDRGF